MSNNVRWRLWAAISVNASSGVTDARLVTSQTGKFLGSRGATGISHEKTGVWVCQLAASEGLSASQCYAVCTPRHTQGVSSAISGAVTVAVEHDSATAKRVTIQQILKNGATTAANVAAINVPFDLCLYRLVE